MMKTCYKRLIGFLIAIMLFFTFLPSMKALAETTYPFVDDGADLFSDTEEKSLSDKISKIRKKYDADVVILTVQNRGAVSANKYVEDYYDANYDAGRINLNTTIVFIDEDDRWVDIQGYEGCENFITNERKDNILDDIESDLHVNNYYKACSEALDQISHYYGFNVNPLTWTWVQILAALIIGSIVTIVMVSHTKGKITTSSRTYLDQAHSGLTAKRDMYLNTTVRKVHIQQSSSGSGSHRSGGGVSSGGHSHSGGGRHF